MFPAWSSCGPGIKEYRLLLHIYRGIPFPNDKGAEIAVDTVTKFMKQRETVFDRIVFNVFKDGDRELYEKLLS